MNENDKIILKFSEDIASIKAILTGDLITMKDDIKEIQAELRQNSEKTSEITALRERINKLENSQVWFSRAIIGGVITIIMGFLTLTK